MGVTHACKIGSLTLGVVFVLQILVLKMGYVRTRCGQRRLYMYVKLVC